MSQTATHEIRFSPAREKRGLKAWGLFEVVDAGFSRGISDHASKEEAEAALSVAGAA